MSIENRSGICATCDGPIHRYPNPNAGQPDQWAHLNRADVIGPNPHDPTPKEPTE
jgi:hypothetical protein